MSSTGPWKYRPGSNGNHYVFRENDEFPDALEIIDCKSRQDAMGKLAHLTELDKPAAAPPLPPVNDLVTLTLITAVEDTLAACPLCSGTGTRQGAPCWKCDRLRTSLKDFKAQ